MSLDYNGKRRYPGLRTHRSKILRTVHIDEGVCVRIPGNPEAIRTDDSALLSARASVITFAKNSRTYLGKTVMGKRGNTGFRNGNSTGIQNTE